MPEFSFDALANNGQRSKGTLTASSEREVMAMLDARGLFPVTIAPIKTQASHRFGRRVKARTMATFYAQLADLLRSGVPLLRSLDILERQSVNPALSEVLREVRARVADGTGPQRPVGPIGADDDARGHSLRADEREIAWRGSIRKETFAGA